MADLTPRTPPTAGTTAPRTSSWPSAATRSATSPLGLEMGGLDGWEYPYQEILIDEQKGQVVGFWKQIADATRADGTHYEVAGIGGSWFGYAGDFQWRLQRDWFDYGNAAACFIEMMGDGTLSEGMTARMHRSPRRRPPRPLRHRPGPAPIWPPR